MADQVVITIAGKPCTGKTTIAAVITQALRDAGIEVSFEASSCDQAHHEFLLVREGAATAALAELATEITIKEVHINRAGVPIEW